MTRNQTYQTQIGFPTLKRIMIAAIVVSACFFSTQSSFAQNSRHQYLTEGRKEATFIERRKQNVRLVANEFRHEHRQVVVRHEFIRHERPVFCGPRFGFGARFGFYPRVAVVLHPRLCRERVVVRMKHYDRRSVPVRKFRHVSPASIQL